jgi:hypothetical protein
VSGIKARHWSPHAEHLGWSRQAFDDPLLATGSDLSARGESLASLEAVASVPHAEPMDVLGWACVSLLPEARARLAAGTAAS